MALTTSTEASADAVHALLAVDLVDDDLAAFEDAGLDFGRVVEHNARVVARHSRYSGDGEGLPINDDGLSLPARVIVSTSSLGFGVGVKSCGKTTEIGNSQRHPGDLAVTRDVVLQGPSEQPAAKRKGLATLRSRIPTCKTPRHGGPR